MKENEFLDGISNIEADVVERFVSMDNKLQQKRSGRANARRIWIRFGAIAACLAIIAGAVFLVPMLRGDDPVTIPNTGTTEDPGIVIQPNQNYTPIVFDATASPEQLSGSSLEFIVGTSTYVGGAQADPVPPQFEFSEGIAVKAKVVGNYPDTYYKLDVSSSSHPEPYRLIQMETLEVISGNNVPQYFLYLIPEYVYVDMSVYDSLLISMSQLGVENYVLRNGTQNRIESFELLMFADYQDEPELGNIIAFSNGIFDESLWQNYTWLYGYQFGRYYLDYPEHSYLVVARGDSESTVISAIKQQYEDRYDWYGGNYQARSVKTLADFTTQAAKDVLEYVKPFANGVFSQWYSEWGHELIFRRYINGCQTEETVRIDLLTEEVTYSEVRYTREDMERMENISLHLSQKAAEYGEQLPTPPHTDPAGKELLCLNLYAWYVKVDGKLYGVIKTAWKYEEDDDYYCQYYDEAFVLYDMSASTATDISREDLIKIVGNRNIYTGEYGVGIEIPMC